MGSAEKIKKYNNFQFQATQEKKKAPEKGLWILS